VIYWRLPGHSCFPGDSFGVVSHQVELLTALLRNSSIIAGLYLDVNSLMMIAQILVTPAPQPVARHLGGGHLSGRTSTIDKTCPICLRS